MANPRNLPDPLVACDHDPRCADFWPCATMGESLQAFYAKTAPRLVPGREHKGTWESWPHIGTKEQSTDGRELHSERLNRGHRE